MPFHRPFHLKTLLKCFNGMVKRSKAILTLHYCAKKNCRDLSTCFAVMVNFKAHEKNS